LRVAWDGPASGSRGGSLVLPPRQGGGIWPLAVLLASAAILQVYYQLDYPGIYPAVPLSAALATAWAAWPPLLSLLVAGFFVLAGIGVGYQTLVPNEPAV
jgi:hypothetical protein